VDATSSTGVDADVDADADADADGGGAMWLQRSQSIFRLLNANGVSCN